MSSIGRHGYTRNIKKGTLEDSFTGTININRTTFVEAIYLHFTSKITVESHFKLTLDSAEGPEYDTVLRKVDLNGLEDYVYVVPEPWILLEGDKLLLEYVNGIDKPDYGLTIIIREARAHT